MSEVPMDWRGKGFGRPPILHFSPSGGLLLYRCWGERRPGVGSSEWGSGYFALTKPASVIDAEMRFNIVDWDNGVRFVSTFRLKPGNAYWLGSIAHGKSDAYTTDSQAFVDGPLEIKMQLVRSKEVLRHDGFVSSQDGHSR